MIQFLAVAVAPILNLPVIRRIRRNHGLEHATIHVLSHKLKTQSMAGRSTAAGFHLYGNIPTHEVEIAVNEALERLRSGEHRLAIHPNCGTGLVTAGTLTSLAALAGTSGMKRGLVEKLTRLPTVILLSTMSLVLSQPLGLALQEHFTTLGDPGDMEFAGINRYELTIPLAGQRLTVHFVRTRAG
jgi:hypothetical protein